MPEPDPFLHSYSTSRSSPSGSRTRGKMAKKKQHFLPREAEAGCTGCPIVWQSSGELYLSNLLLKGRVSVAALVWVSLQECAFFLYILQSLAGPLVRLVGSEAVREDGIE